MARELGIHEPLHVQIVFADLLLITFATGPPCLGWHHPLLLGGNQLVTLRDGCVHAIIERSTAIISQQRWCCPTIRVVVVRIGRLSMSGRAQHSSLVALQIIEAFRGRVFVPSLWVASFWGANISCCKCGHSTNRLIVNFTFIGVARWARVSSIVIVLLCWGARV